MWNYTGTWGYYWAIDDIQVTGLPINRQLSNITVPGAVTNCYNASQTITVAGSGTTFTVQNGGSATLIAGLKISVLPGAVVQSGGYFHGYIAPAGPFCWNPSYLPGSAVGQEEINASMPSVFVENLFRVYPNPTTGSFTLELKNHDETGKISVEIYNMTGEKVQSSEFSGEQKHDFSLSGNPTGIYLIKVASEKNVGISRIIRQ